MTHRRLLAPVVLVATLLALGGCWWPGGPGPEVCDPEDTGGVVQIQLEADGQTDVSSCLHGTDDEDEYTIALPPVAGTLSVVCVVPDRDTAPSYAPTLPDLAGSALCTDAEEDAEPFTSSYGPDDDPAQVFVGPSGATVGNDPYTLVVRFTPDND
jgi:hypothetical protein